MNNLTHEEKQRLRNRAEEYLRDRLQEQLKAEGRTLSADECRTMRYRIFFLDDGAISGQVCVAAGGQDLDEDPVNFKQVPLLSERILPSQLQAA